jgi:hypothetical protein
VPAAPELQCETLGDGLDAPEVTEARAEKGDVHGPFLAGATPVYGCLDLGRLKMQETLPPRVGSPMTCTSSQPSLPSRVSSAMPAS